MKKIHKFYTCIIIMMLLTIGCQRKIHTEKTFSTKWPTSESLSDSLCSALDLAILYRKDSMQLNELLNQLKIASHSSDSCRTLYMEYQVLDNLGHKTQSNFALEKLIKEVDSTKHPYLWHRIQEAIIDSNNLKIENYTRLMRYSEYFLKYGDLLMYHLTRLKLAHLLKKSGLYDIALDYYREASDFFSEEGYGPLKAFNNINISSMLYAQGQTYEADSIGDLLIQDTLLSSNQSLYEVVNRNQYIFTGNPIYLMRAYNITEQNGNMSPQQQVLDMLFAQLKDAEGDLDSALSYGQKSFENQDNNDQILRMKAAWVYAQLLKKAYRHEEALEVLNTYCILADSIFSEQSRMAEMTMDFRNQLSLMEQDRKYERAIHRRNNLLIASGVLVFIIIAGLLFMYFRHVQLARRLKLELELEKNRHSLAARTLAGEKLAQSLQNVHDYISDMEKEGQKSLPIHQLDSFVKMESSDQEAWESFVDIFEKSHPAFIEMLTKRTPGLSANYIRLCCYLKAGLTVNDIARLLKVKPESVHQSRWRLRKKLNLDDDMTLEEFLHTLC
ncbi:MAG: hypothetical protein LIP09_06245 [Bacteroidales bacterium]|nr:hypothetical protein [Bacteroidales bacterium]